MPVAAGLSALARAERCSVSATALWLVAVALSAVLGLTALALLGYRRTPELLQRVVPLDLANVRR